MLNRKYVFDLSDLQYKRVKLRWKERLLHTSLWFAATVILAIIYGTIFENLFGSPKEKILKQEIENIKLQYSLIGRELDNKMASLNGFRISDDNGYRPILEMDTISESYRKAGYGGVDRFRDLTGYMNSDLLILYRTKIEVIKNMAKVQTESFKTVAERSLEWKREIDHLPIISPVDVTFRRGDGFRWRKIHPVLGTSQMHNGQDFPCPYGTKVYATGNGKIIESGWNSGGFGNCIVIDHGYGLQSTYGHLSNIRVVIGMNVKRGDLLGLSGSSGISSGPHLHYQIDKFGKHVNPINFFNDDISIEKYNEMIQTLESESRFR